MKLQKCSVKGQQPDTRSHISHDSSHIKFLKDKATESDSRSECTWGQGWGEGADCRELEGIHCSDGHVLKTWIVLMDK